MDKTWKAVERRVAAKLNGKRTGPNVLEDVSHDTFSVEVKHRKKLPSWLTGAYRQAKHNSPGGKIPIVVLHQANSREYLVVLDLDDLESLLTVRKYDRFA